MRAIVIQSPWNVVTMEREVPRPKEGEALLRAICGNICGSGLASYRGMSAYVSYPRTIGHEFAAEVVEVGDNVYGIKPSMIVAGNPYFNCGTCYSYRRGMVNRCVRNETMGAQRRGVFSDYLTIPVGHLYDGQGTNPKELALTEPLRISCHGVSQVSVEPNDKVPAFGIGIIGILAGAAAKNFGAWVYIMNVAGEKVEATARDFHLDDGLVNESREWLDALAREITDGGGFDAAVGAVGISSTFLGCMQAAVSRGCAVVIGIAKHSAGFSFPEPQHKELDMYGSRTATAADFAAAMKLVKDGFVDLKKLISRIYPARSTAEVLRGLSQSYGGIIKAEPEF